MQVTAQQLCDMLEGTLEGNPDVLVSKAAKIEEGGSGSITFLANPRYEKFAYTTQASVMLVDRTFAPKQPVAPTLIRVDDVYGSISFLLDKFSAEMSFKNPGIHPSASVDPSVELPESVTVGPHVVIESGVTIGEGAVLIAQVFVGRDASVGSNTLLHPGVRIAHECSIGDDCILHGNVVVGGDGFGFKHNDDGSYDKVPQVGNVIIGDQVEIGSNTSIDRATMGSTVIKDGVKLDSLIQIAHNVEIGENTVIAAQAGIAGSTRIGKNCLIGGQVGIVGHITIADGTKIQAQSGVSRAVKKSGVALHGTPAFAYNDFMRSHVVFRQLPDLSRTVNDLKKQIEELQEKASRTK